VVDRHRGGAVISARTTVDCLHAYDAVIAGIPDWVHISRFESLGIPLALAVAGKAGEVPSMRRAVMLASALGIDSVAADVFDLPAHRLATLPPGLLRRVFRARGLLRHRTALRQCLDASVRRRLKDWLHPAVFDAVMLDAPTDGQRDAGGLPMPWPTVGSDADPSASLRSRADPLAWEGFCLFRQDRVWQDPSVAKLLAMGFPQDAVKPADLDVCPGAKNGSAWVLERLHLFVPEAPWLCG